MAQLTSSPRHSVVLVEEEARGGRRGKEHKEIWDGAKDIPQEVIEYHEKEYGNWVCQAALKKLEKQSKFPINTIVLVHLSAWLFFLEVEDYGGNYSTSYRTLLEIFIAFVFFIRKWPILLKDF